MLGFLITFQQANDPCYERYRGTTTGENFKVIFFFAVFDKTNSSKNDFNYSGDGTGTGSDRSKYHVFC